MDVERLQERYVVYRGMLSGSCVRVCVQHAGGAHVYERCVDVAAGISNVCMRLPELQGARLLGARGLREQCARSMVVERLLDACGLHEQCACVDACIEASGAVWGVQMDVVSGCMGASVRAACRIGTYM